LGGTTRPGEMLSLGEDRQTKGPKNSCQVEGTQGKMPSRKGKQKGKTCRKICSLREELARGELGTRVGTNQAAASLTGQGGVKSHEQKLGDKPEKKCVEPIGTGRKVLGLKKTQVRQ